MKVLVILCGMLVSGLYADLLVPVDGYNIFVIDDYCNLDTDAPLQVSEYRSGKFYTLPEVTEKSTFLSGGMLFGAEIGDPLLNVYANPHAYENRDHRSLLFAEYNCRSLPLAIVGRYRYVDTYTDRFDEHWEKYQEILGKRMYHANKGVGYEALGAAVWNGIYTHSTTTINSYDHWHTTPYYYSPLLEKGILLDQSFSVHIPSSLALVSKYRFIRSWWYYDHQTASVYNDNVLENRLSFQAPFGVSAWMEHFYSSMIEPSSSFSVGGTIPYYCASFSASIHGYGDGTVSGACGATCSFGKTVQCSSMVCREYICKAREYVFNQFDLPVAYQTEALARNNLFMNGLWEDTLMVPIRSELWWFYTSHVIGEQVDTLGNRAQITHTAVADKGQSLLGIRSGIELEGNIITASIQPALLIPIGGKKTLPVFVSSMLDAELRIRSTGNDPIICSVMFHYNSAPELMYPMQQANGSVSKTFFKADDQYSGTISLHVPFVFYPMQPFVSSTAFSLVFGPFSFTDKTRVRLHPRGNRFGPEIYTGIIGTIR